MERPLGVLVWLVLLFFEAAAAEEEEACDGDLVWDDCHSACPFVCGREDPEICPMFCVVGCQCPRGSWRLAEDSDRCVEKREQCQSALVAGGDRDDHGCIGSAGYQWCAVRGECVRPWETTCCLADAYDNCVTDGCEAWFDGCNHCQVSWESNDLACTRVACDDPPRDEPKCLGPFDDDDDDDFGGSLYGGSLENERVSHSEDDDEKEGPPSERKAGCLADTYGNCVPYYCQRWFDGCNLCEVSRYQGSVDCDVAHHCEEPGETRCIFAGCVADPYGNCVPYHCEQWFDGCNLCEVSWQQGGGMGCDVAHQCEEPDEARCISPTDLSSSPIARANTIAAFTLVLVLASLVVVLASLSFVTKVAVVLRSRKETQRLAATNERTPLSPANQKKQPAVKLPDATDAATNERRPPSPANQKKQPAELPATDATDAA